MTRTQWRLSASHLSLAAFLAAGLAATPFSLGGDLAVKSQAAIAQSDSSGSGSGSGSGTGSDNGAGSDGSTGGTDNLDSDNAAETEGPGVAEERATARAAAIPDETADNVYEILGTTREEAEAADTTTSATAQYGPLAAYQTEAERGNLDAAAENLAAIAEDPVTEEMVTEVNTELGIETTLTSKQIADAAARKQDGSSN